MHNHFGHDMKASSMDFDPLGAKIDGYFKHDGTRSAPGIPAQSVTFPEEHGGLLALLSSP